MTLSGHLPHWVRGFCSGSPQAQSTLALEMKHLGSLPGGPWRVTWSLRLFLHLIPTKLTPSLALLFSKATCLTRALPLLSGLLACALTLAATYPVPNSCPTDPSTPALLRELLLSAERRSQGLTWTGPSLRLPGVLLPRDPHSHVSSPVRTPALQPPHFEALLTTDGGRCFIWGQNCPVYSRVPCLSTLLGT